MPRPGQESLWDAAVAASPVAMTIVGLDGSVLAVNRALCDLLGYAEAELTSSTVDRLVHPDDLEGDRDLARRMLAGQLCTHRSTKRYLHADGTDVWADLWVCLVRGPDQAPRHFLSHLVALAGQPLDSEELVRARGVVERQRRTTTAVLDTLDIGVVSLDREGAYVQLNRRHSDFLALAFPQGHHRRAGQVGEVYAANGFTPVPSQDMPSVRATAGEEFDDHRIWVGADPLTRRALSVSARSVLDADGSFAGAVLAYSDITELMRALQAREQFVTSVSHELRTPLTAVLGHLELMLGDEDLDEEVVRPLQVVHRNALRLRNLVSDLLQTAQQSQGRLELSRTATDVSDLVTEAVESARPLATSAGVRLVVDVPGPVVAWVDRTRLRQVVDNVVYNAVKYTDRGGRVDLRLRADGHAVVVEVSDTGIGIEPADLDRLFVPFFRSREAQERKVPGIGLGLGIARAIVEAHEGHLDVRSTPGLGSTFVVTVPVGDTGPGPTRRPPGPGPRPATSHPPAGPRPG